MLLVSELWLLRPFTLHRDYLHEHLSSICDHTVRSAFFVRRTKQNNTHHKTVTPHFWMYTHNLSRCSITPRPFFTLLAADARKRVFLSAQSAKNALSIGGKSSVWLQLKTQSVENNMICRGERNSEKHSPAAVGIHMTALTKRERYVFRPKKSCVNSLAVVWIAAV